MKECWSLLRHKAAGLSVAALFTLSPLVFCNSLYALTISSGEPFGGRLINGVQFPSQLPGYELGKKDFCYTTPEVVGALLDALEMFADKYPDTCDVFFGDFSRNGGGRLKGHESHQNGRDVDMGLFAKGNVALHGFVPMNSDILDVQKTWDMIQLLLSTQRIQQIFLDRKIQVKLYNYASKQGVDRDYLAKLFKDAGAGGGRDSVIQHEPGHRNHMHLRFYAPWSTLAGQISGKDPERLAMIESAQQSYLPQRINYFVQGSEKDLDSLAAGFGVSPKELCKWNRLSPGLAPMPGECFVFYKRAFEVETVGLANSLQPRNTLGAAPQRKAPLPFSSLSDRPGRMKSPGSGGPGAG